MFGHFSLVMTSINLQTLSILKPFPITAKKKVFGKPLWNTAKTHQAVHLHMLIKVTAGHSCPMVHFLPSHAAKDMCLFKLKQILFRWP